MTLQARNDFLRSGLPGLFRSRLADAISVFKDYITQQRVLSLTSMRPVNQYCLEQEMLQIARALLKIRQWVQPQYALALRADEVLCRIPRAERSRFKEQIEAITYLELASILPPGRTAVHQKASSSTAKVYRCKSVPQVVYPAPPCAALEWTIHEEPLEGPDNFTQPIVEHVLAGNSMCVVGAAGTGKTVTKKAVKAALEASGLQCQAICLTHAGARNMGQ